MTRVLLATGFAPYLGGTQTWRLLRRRLPQEWEFTEWDPLGADWNDDAEIMRKTVDLIEAHDLTIAHGPIARTALLAAGEAKADRALLLISPTFVPAGGPPLRRALFSVLRSPPISAILTLYALRKLAHLRRDREYVNKQLEMLLVPSAITDDLLFEAVRRVNDPKTLEAVKHTGDSLRRIFSPIEPDAIAKVARRHAIVRERSGNTMERQSLIKAGWDENRITTAPGLSPMIENPDLVAREALRLV